MLQQAFGWEVEDFADLNKTAANAAFCDDATRERVLKKLELT